MHESETASFRDSDFSVGVGDVSSKYDGVFVGDVELSKGVGSVKLSCGDGVCDKVLLTGSDSLDSGGL